ncbi:MAG: sugar-binding domain-containing protein, partial [Planctomycetota bacterium]
MHSYFLTLLLCGSCFGIFDNNVEWQNESIFRVNKQPAHSVLMPFADRTSALTKERMDSSYCQVLNGEWKFNWSGHPDNRPKNFYETLYDDSSWKEINVPSSVELEGYGTPLYSNEKYPFKKDPPNVMGVPPENYSNFKDRNPVSSYRRKFTLTEDWSERRTTITFNGVSSAFYLWVNGRRVGYSQDSRTPAEFDITKYVKTGENLL